VLFPSTTILPFGASSREPSARTKNEISIRLIRGEILMVGLFLNDQDNRVRFRRQITIFYHNRKPMIPVTSLYAMSSFKVSAGRLIPDTRACSVSDTATLRTGNETGKLLTFTPARKNEQVHCIRPEVPSPTLR